MELSVISTEFLTDREQRGCNVRTVAYYADLLRWLSEYLALQGVTDSCAVTTDHLEAYTADLRQRKKQGRAGQLSPITTRNWLLGMKIFFTWAHNTGRIPTDPAHPIPVPRKHTPLPKALTPQQARKLLAGKMSIRDRAVISLLLDSGIRVSECAALTLPDLDNDLMTVRIREGKRDKQRVCVFAETTRDALRAWLAKRAAARCDAVFVGRGGKQLKPDSVYEIVKRAADAVGLHDEVSPHKLRHSFATFYLDAGGAIQDLAKLMGHDDIATTTIYNAVSNRMMRIKHRKFSPMHSLTCEDDLWEG